MDNQLSNLLLNQSKDLIWIINLEFELLFANNTYFNFMKDIIGVDKKLNDSAFIQVFGEDDIKKWKAYYLRAIAGEYFETEEKYAYSNSNKIQYSQVTFEPLTDGNHKVIAVACQSKDITKTIKRRAEADFLMDASLDVFCSIDEHSNFVYVSAASLNLWGYLPEELIGKPFPHFIVEEDIPKTNDIGSEILSGKEIKSFVNRYKKKNGEIAYNVWSARWDNINKLMYCVARDGKGKIEQEEKIELSEQRFKALVQDGSDLITITDAAGNYTYVSPTSTIITGFTPEEFIGRNALEFIHPDDTARALSSLEQLATQTKVVLDPFRTKNSKNEWRWAETVLTNMLDNPAVKGIVANTRDITDRIEQEEKIELSEQRFKALVQEGSDLVGILDLEGNYIYVSPTSIAVLGITPDEFIGKNAFSFIHPDDAERTLVGLQKITTQNRVVLEPFRFQNHNKEWRWIETILTNMIDNPAVKGIVSNSRDITKQITVLKQIEENELFNRTVVESSPDCLKVLDTDGRLLYMNFNGLCQMEIDDFSIFKNKNWWTLWGNENEALVKAAVDKALTGEVAQFTAFCPTAKGTPKWWDVMVSPVGKSGEAVQQLISVSRDITAQKAEEQRLKILESVITNTRDAVLITEAAPFDEPGPKIIYVNEAFTKMTGYTSEEVIGKTPRILQGPKSNYEELAKLGRAIRNLETYELTTINYKKNGEEFWVNFTVIPVRDEKGLYAHLIAIERDVTEQKIIEFENELINNIVSIFNRSYENELTECLTKLCALITKFGNFDVAEIWLTTIDGKTINRVTNYVDSKVGDAFFNATKNVKTCKLGEGMSGYVWENQKIEICGDTEKKYLIEIKDATKKAGIKTIVGIPLKHKEEIIAVLVLGTEKEKSTQLKYLELFKKLESVIGSELSRKKTEIELAQIFNFTPDMICVAGFDGYLKRINPAGLELLGYSLDEMLSLPIKSFIHEDDRLLTTEKQTELYNGSNLRNFENRYVTKQGKIVWLSWTSDSIPEQGIVYAVAKNITEEKKLRELNRQTRSLAKIGSWELDLINGNLYWSDEVHQLHETDPKYFVPNLETAINFYREDFREIVRINVEKCITTNEPFDYEVVLVTNKNNELWVRAIGNAEFVEGVCTRIFGSFQNINERMQAEIRLQSLADNLPGVVFQYLIYPDGTDNLKSVTKGSQQVWGFSADEVLQNNQLVWDRILLGGEFDKVQKSITDSIASKTKWTSRWKYIMPNGDTKTHLGYGSPNFLVDGTILFNSVILDVTQEAFNEGLLERVTKLAKIGSWEIDLKNNQTYWSTMVHNILETDPVTFVPDRETNINFFREDFHTTVISQLKDCKEKGIDISFEVVVVTANKNEKWVRVIGSAEMFDGNINRIIGSMQDIQERKEAEEKLIDSEQKYRLLALQLQLQQIHLTNAQEVAKFGSWETELPSLKIKWSEETYRIFGANREDFEPTHEKFLNLVHPLDKDKVDKIFSESVLAPSKAQYIIEHRIITLSGEEKVVEERWKVNYNKKRIPILVVGSCQDITERKKAEESVLLANERFEKVTEATNDAIWDWDMVNKTYYRSKATEHFFGKDAVGLFPESDLWTKDFFHPEDIVEIKRSFYDAIADPLCEKWELEYRLINEQEQLLYVIDRAVIMRDQSGKAIRMVGAMTDISEQKSMTVKLEELNRTLQQYAVELERSNEELEQFAFVASHDLQEPLRMISSFMDLLQKKYSEKLDEKAHLYIHFASDGAKRMKQIILDLLEYSRTSKPTEGKEEVDMNETLSEFKVLRRNLISEKNATITSTKLPKIITYKSAITQILHCLLDNALKYSRQDIETLIDINMKENQSEWEFSIKDNGIGIDAQFFEKIFIIFQRLHNKENYAGTGIGLSIAKRHTEFLGGRIWLESEVGKGSVFYFTISKNK